MNENLSIWIYYRASKNVLISLIGAVSVAGSAFWTDNSCTIMALVDIFVEVLDYMYCGTYLYLDMCVVLGGQIYIMRYYPSVV